MMLMSAEVVLEVDKVSKIYSRQRTATQKRLGSLLIDAVAGRRYRSSNEELRAGEFFAVKDVSLSLKRGEALGIIGLNGSGKTTLLRMLAGQLLPDGGQITVMGHTASMIDLTAGFQPAASGRENIFLRGAALGYSRARMMELFDEIVAFSELEDAIEAPVASYSSGMTMRLAFSIVSTVAPDILFIDEVLAVGDFRFRQKCLARIREIRERTSFVMVSHNMRDISRFCEHAIVLHKGDVMFRGASSDAVAYFESEIEQQAEPVAKRSLEKAMGTFFENSDAISDVQAYWCDELGNAVEKIAQGDEVYFDLSFMCSIDSKRLIVGIPIWSEDGTLVTGFSTENIFKNIERGADGRVSLRLRVDGFYFNAGTYHSNVAIVDGGEFLWRKPNEPLRVLPSMGPTWGIANIPYQWSYRAAGKNTNFAMR